MIVFVPVLTGVTDSVDGIGWAQFGMCIFVVYHLMTDQRARDTFADFPAPDKPANSGDA